MKFDQPAGTNPIDQLKVIGKPTDRIDGKFKTTGTAPYAYERHDVAGKLAVGYILGAGIAKGKIASLNADDARRAPGVLAVLSTLDRKAMPVGMMNTANLFGGAEVQHYHQAIALVVAETYEQARFAAGLIRVDYDRGEGKFDLAAAASDAKPHVPDKGEPAVVKIGNFDGAFQSAEVTLDANYTTPDHSHAMMEPFATIASWDGPKLTVYTANQMIAWSRKSLAKIMGLKLADVRLDSPFIGGGFGGKLFIRADVPLAALGAKETGRPVKLMMQRALIANNSTHRPATIQRIRIGATRTGKITAIAHESVSGNLAGGDPETATQQTRQLYAGENRMIALKLAVLDLPEGNAMRAPGEAPGLMALEIAMDEMAEKLGMDPVEFRVINDTQVDPEKPERKFSQRQLNKCLQDGATKFGWAKRARTPGTMSEGRYLIGMGVAAAIRGNLLMKSAARVRLESNGRITVETDMTDIGTGTYTIIAQTAAEMMGVPLDRVTVKLGDSDHPESAGSGGQWGANNSTSGVYAACVKLRDAIATKLGIDGDVTFADGMVRGAGKSAKLAEAAKDGPLTGEDAIEYGDLDEQYLQSTFGAHFVEVAVDRYTGQTEIRRMLAVCAAGRILNPKSARSQVIGGMVMGAGAALTEELAVDKRFGFFVNHDLASYEVPVHADIPHQEVVFLDEVDPLSSPMKAKGVGELGICGVAAAVANAVYNATGVRVRDYPITLDKYLDRLPAVA